MATMLDLTPTTRGTSVATPSTHLARTGAIAAAASALAVTATAGIAHAAGMHFNIAGKPIPLAGFANLTVVFVAIGTIIAAVLARRARQPHHTFLVTTLTLTALSFVPDLLVDATVATKLTLMLTHVVVASVAIPLLASRLAD